ncbi:MAG: hypothetical protein LAO21_09650 [Acidobacteriia bacterium]|nr:hypothetical protein [Terriglobia bacterium]
MPLKKRLEIYYWDFAKLRISAKCLSLSSLSLKRMIVGPAQYPLGWIIVVVLDRLGLWEIHTWKNKRDSHLFPDLLTRKPVAVPLLYPAPVFYHTPR